MTFATTLEFERGRESRAAAALGVLFATVDEAISDVRSGKFVVVANPDDPERQGTLVAAAELVGPAEINFMATHARGVICLGLTSERCDDSACAR